MLLIVGRLTVRGNTNRLTHRRENLFFTAHYSRRLKDSIVITLEIESIQDLCIAAA
jgi:hypothetical protein